MLGISVVAAQLAASQEGLSSVNESVKNLFLVEQLWGNILRQGLQLKYTSTRRVATCCTGDVTWANFNVLTCIRRDRLTNSIVP
jgi:hypothetical protein